MYGSELWGIQNMPCIESVQMFACKRLLNVTANSCNNAIMGDLGRYPLYIDTAKRCVKFWLRILRLPTNRLTRLCYDMLKHFDNLGHINWVTYLRQNLYQNGYGYVWENQGVANEKSFVLQYVDRLKNQYIQQWSSNCRDNNKLLYYTQYKDTYDIEAYVNTIDISKFRSALASFRSSSHSLLVERGRHFGISREQRVCIYCETLIEDELHFVMCCPLYEDLRINYIDRRFTEYPCLNNFVRLMTCGNDQVIKNLAMFIFYSFKRRQEFSEGISS
jgi:hypothetical protein